MTRNLSVSDVLLQSIRALEAALQRTKAAASGPLARFAELPPFDEARLFGVRLTRHKARAVLRCSCGEVWEGGAYSLNDATLHAYYQPFADGGRTAHVIEGQWIHGFRITMRRRNWWQA